jgi:hypothetical protein
METTLTESEMSALLSSNESGEIIIPCGSAMEIEARLETLLCLEEAGFASRNEGRKFYRPFVLTPKGKSLRAELLRVSTTNMPAESHFCGVPLHSLETCKAQPARLSKNRT